MKSTFENLLVWQRSVELAVEVCKEVNRMRSPSLADQMARAAVSIPSNIAEGAERLSPKEFSAFIGYAKGSAGELRTQIIIASRLGLLEIELAERLKAELREISSILHGLAKSLTAQ